MLAPHISIFSRASSKDKTQCSLSHSLKPKPGSSFLNVVVADRMLVESHDLGRFMTPRYCGTPNANATHIKVGVTQEFRQIPSQENCGGRVWFRIIYTATSTCVT